MIAERFQQHFGVAANRVASAPGRVNLIGEHTDYNEGFVLPIAIDRRIQVAASRRADGRIVAFAEEFSEERAIDASSQPGASGSRRWQDYVAGVALALVADQGRFQGANLLIAGNVPVGAGLASSAALELAVARAMCALSDIPWKPVEMARLAQRAENQYVGVNCGIMDQVASSTGRRGHAMLLDCRTLERSDVELPPDVSIVVMDTGVRRTLSASEYNLRRSACEEAVERIRALAPDVRSLRDVTPVLLQSAASSMEAATHRRARHVVDENRRPAALVRALEARDFATAGRLMNDSHASLRDLYDVSSVHLNLICDAARAHAACYGARMTGAGFGGCAIALVRADGIQDFMHRAQAQYEARTYKKSSFFAANADEGARIDS